MLELITKLFSVEPGSMRAWRWRRVLVVVWVFPLFGLIAMWNQIGLALDWVLYPGFRKQPIQSPSSSFPSPDRDHQPPSRHDRSWHALHRPRVVGVLDCTLGHPQEAASLSVAQRALSIQSLLRKTDTKLFKGLNVIHKASLFCKEEDELA